MDVVVDRGDPYAVHIDAQGVKGELLAPTLHQRDGAPSVCVKAETPVQGGFNASIPARYIGVTAVTGGVARGWVLGVAGLAVSNNKDGILFEYAHLII